MDIVTCPHCLFSFEPTAGQRPPPWCRRCGGDLRSKPITVPEPAEELVPLTAAPAAKAAGGRWSNRPAIARPVATAAAADTPSPAAGRRASQRKADRHHAPADTGWTPEMARRVEELAARETDTRPPAWWCYLFAGACAIIPVLTLGGAVPAVIGFSGASACAKVGHSHTLSSAAKLLACIGIVVLTWGVFITLLLVAFKVNAGLAPRR